MSYRNLQSCLADLEQAGHLLRIEQEIDPYLEMAEIQRRVFAAGGPALLFTQVRSCRFPMASNLFGTRERVHFIFRRTLKKVQALIALKADPERALAHPWQSLKQLPTLLHMRPRWVRRAPVMACECRISDLPQLTSWPRDGGPYVTLPQVYTEDPDQPGWQRSNLGMYRVQLTGAPYAPDREIGLHYQIHRGIGIHHAAAIRRGEPLRVNIFVGGTPAMSIAAVMPLPEGMSELVFAGALAGHRIPLVANPAGLPIYAEADFCITGTIPPDRLLPEGPFGDHLGYYSLAHPFPMLQVERVWHRPGAVWPFTVVGRPPQEDTLLGDLIHELTGPLIPTVVAGVKQVHAVDAAGVHPLLLAVGSERYTPYETEQQPRELLTQGNALFGQGQLSLAKYLLIVAAEGPGTPDVQDIPGFFSHLLRRVNWERDLHFQTCTTIDTLDYSGTRLNEGSKLLIAAVGPPRRELGTEVPRLDWPQGFGEPRLCLPGVIAISGPPHSVGPEADEPTLRAFCQALEPRAEQLASFPLIVIVDNSVFAASKLDHFLWVTFTRSNPAADVDGVFHQTRQKHWGCRGPLVIDARSKGHHAPPLETDPQIARRVDRLFASGGPLNSIRET